MKLRYYLRGIGIGMLVTAAILHFTFADNTAQAMTDEEIMARAAQLGMIENTVLKPPEDEASISINDTDDGSISLNLTGVSEDMADAGSVSADAGTVSTDGGIEVIDVADNTSGSGTHIEFDENPDGEVIGNNRPTATPTPTPTATPTPTPTATPTPTPTATPTPTPTPTATPTNGHYTTITVNSGDGSYAVAKKLAEAGLVSSAAEFDQYLCEHDYDKHLTTGSHRIPDGADEQQIAEILSSKPE